MMWNWALSALASGAGVVLYDGSVSFPDRDSLLRVVGRERVTVFGATPSYLQYLADAGVTSGPEHLARVREILSTGSVLPAHLHRWAKRSLRDVPLQSISGGTDILGCFAMGSPWTDVYEGESSCIGLGLDVRTWPSAEGAEGLVCVAPFPSRGTRAWTHGDGE
jgi:acetoacetyl-CoA synthetase